MQRLNSLVVRQTANENHLDQYNRDRLNLLKKCSIERSDHPYSAGHFSQGTESNQGLASLHYFAKTEKNRVVKEIDPEADRKARQQLYELQQEEEEDPSENLRNNGSSDDESDSGQAELEKSKNLKKQSKEDDFGLLKVGIVSNKIKERTKDINLQNNSERRTSMDKLELSFIIPDPSDQEINDVDNILSWELPSSLKSVSNKKQKPYSNNLSAEADASQCEGMSTCENIRYDHEKEFKKLIGLHNALLEKYQRNMDRVESSDLQAPSKKPTTETTITSKVDILSRCVPFKNKFISMRIPSSNNHI